MKVETRQMRNGCALLLRTITDAPSGIPVYLWGGVFGTYMVWSRLAKFLRQRHPLILVDYPQFDEASPIFTQRRLTVPMLASFQQELMAQHSHEKAILTGWSFGTQVAAECASAHPHSIAALIAISGVPGKPFAHISDPLFETIGIRPRLSQTVDWLAQNEDAISRVRKVVRKNDHPSRWAKRLGLAAPAADELILDAAIRDFVNIPPRQYGYYMEIAARHDATEAVSHAPFPVLAVSGKLDRLVPPSRTREFVSGNPNGEFLQVKGGTHFVPLEYPELIALKMDDFFHRNKLV